MGNYQISIDANWTYSDTPTKALVIEVASVSVTPDTKGGSAPVGKDPTEITAHADASGPDKTTSGDASMSAFKNVTITWKADAAGDLPVAKDYTFTVNGSASYDIAAKAAASANADASANGRVSIDTSESTVFSDSLTAPANKSASGSGPKQLKSLTLNVSGATQSYKVQVAVSARAKRTGEGASASANAKLTGLDVTVT